MSLTNPDKLVTEERLNEYHNTILPYLGGMPDILANKFSKGDMYSTDEKMIGQWIDGKPVYQKTFSGIFSSNSDETLVTADINLNDNVLIEAKGFLTNDINGVKYLIGYSNTTYYNSGVLLLPGGVRIDTAGSQASVFRGQPYVITLQYTKTTDSPVAIGIDTDYSTEEKIVGTWIDGKPIYQKTIQTTMPSTSSQNTIVEKIVSIGASIDMVVDHRAMMSFIVNNKEESFMKIDPINSLNTLSEIDAKIMIFNNNKSDVASVSQKNSVYILNKTPNWNGFPLYITIQYIKTTD